MSDNETPEFRIDCISMKRDIQKAIAKETRGMTVSERVAYYRQLSNAWHESRPERAGKIAARSHHK